LALTNGKHTIIAVPFVKLVDNKVILKIILEKEVEFQKEILELTSMQKEYTASSLIASKTNQKN